MYLVCRCFDPLSLHDALPICRPRGIAPARAEDLALAARGGCARGRAQAVDRRGGDGPHAGARGDPRREARTRRRSAPDVDLHPAGRDRKSTRLNSSHRCISYAAASTLFPYTTLFRSAVLAELRRLALKTWRWPLAADVLAVERKQSTGEAATARTLELAEILAERLGRGDEALPMLTYILQGEIGRAHV